MDFNAQTIERMASTILGGLTLFVAFEWVIRVVMFVVVPQRRSTASAYAWLLLIFLYPIFGTIAFLFLANNKLDNVRRTKQRTIDSAFKQAVSEARAHPDLSSDLIPELPPRYAGIARLSENVGQLPPFGGNAIEFLPDYLGVVQRLIADIDAAQRFVHVEYFMFADDETGAPVVDALIRARARGIVVRVLVDHFGNWFFIKPLFRRLRAGGVECHRMLPISLIDNHWSRFDLRNHRKNVVIDGAIGFTGSQNLINANYNKRRNIRNGLSYEELVIRVIVPVVTQMEGVFASDYYSETDVLLDPAKFRELATELQTVGDVVAQVLPSGPGHATQNNELLFAALFHNAQRTIVIATPYFVPDESLMDALTTAARRGVDCQLIVSGIADQFLVSRAQCSFYQELLEVGVRIYLFNAPLLLHAKHLSIDDDVCVLGSSNMDIRSLALDLEISLVIYSADVVRRLRAIEAAHLARSHELTLAEWMRRPWHERVIQNSCRMTSDFV